jgi:hypothetical protein
MRASVRFLVGGAFSAALALGMAGAADATVIGNGSIFLGVNSDGSLNTYDVGPTGRTGIGLFDARTGYEATFDGCTCEGWGAGDAGAGLSVYFNTSTGSGAYGPSGYANVSVSGFSSTTSTATSVVDVYDPYSINDGNSFTNSLRVVHEFLPSTSADLYRVNVYLTNTGADTITDLRYRRVMDWDIEPTPFNEYVSMHGSQNPYVAYTSDNGFASADPLSGPSFILDGTEHVDFNNSGPADHGALFDFQFGALAPNDTKAFTIFYGASLTKASAIDALSSVGAEVYSVAQSSDNESGDQPGNSVFAFGFDIDNDGTTFEHPYLPTDVNTDGGFIFTVPVREGEPIVIDPSVAIGYTFSASVPFLSFQTEFLGDPEYFVHVGLFSHSYTPGTTFVFGDFGLSNVTAFTLDGIDPALGLDPDNGLAFKTKLLMDVAGPTVVTITQTAIRSAGAVPEPSSWAMLILGLGGVGLTLRRRNRAVLQFA